MTKRSQGLRSGSRHKLSRSFKEKGLSPITRSLQTFELGDTVNVVIDSSHQKGQPHHRFHGLTGKVTGKLFPLYHKQVRQDTTSVLKLMQYFLHRLLLFQFF